MAISVDQLLKRFKLFETPVGGIGKWITPSTNGAVLDALCTIEEKPLTRAQINQLLVLAHEGNMSDGCFRYYWQEMPDHTYKLTDLAFPTPNAEALHSGRIASLDHLCWGLYRLYVDALLYFGNVRTAYRHLRILSHEQIREYYWQRKQPVERLKSRGPMMELHNINRDERYYISEMACKSLEADDEENPKLEQVLLDAYRDARKAGRDRVSIKDLLSGDYAKDRHKDSLQQLLFSADEILEARVQNEEELLSQ